MPADGTSGAPSGRRECDVTVVAGVDSSTQSCKVVVCDAESGRVIREAKAPHPDTTEVDPHRWWEAWCSASAGLLDGVEALAVGGQQHGMVALDADGEVVRPALLWNDTRSAGAAEDLVTELGAETWAKAVGSVPVASFTVTKLRWLARHEPENAQRVATVLLPHDWLTWRILDRPSDPTTDRGDASGTGYWSPHTGEYRLDLLESAFGRAVGVPRVLAPHEPAGATSDGVVVAAGTGDNMGAALGLGQAPGDVAVSIGTSGVVCAVHSQATADPSGNVAGFCDATGQFLPLACTLNAARVLSSAAQLLGCDLRALDELALSAPPGADGLTLLPYLDGERTPNLPSAAGTLCGLRRTNSTPAHLARAAVEGLLCGLADGLDALRVIGVQPQHVLLVGGGSQSTAVQALAPDIFRLHVVRPEPAEYVARGAARQAAWALYGKTSPPDWSLPAASTHEPSDEAAGLEVRAQYAQNRRAVFGI
jgi:xylulokinase